MMSGVAMKIEDYALIGDCRTGALVGLDGSIDWLCLPRFDSPSMFGALLGTSEDGRWLLAPTGGVQETIRRYVDDTFILETTFRTDTGVARLIDLMSIDDGDGEVIRRVEGVEGTVEMRLEVAFRFGYGTALPWVRRVVDDDGCDALIATAGPDAVALRGDSLPTAIDHVHQDTFTVAPGETREWSLAWHPSYEPIPRGTDHDDAIEKTRAWWQEWADQSVCDGSYPEEVRRSLLVLRALTDHKTGGIVAAATTSLPEKFGGSRNWDYRYCWLRDAALTLEALLAHGYFEEAQDWREWLLRAVAGDPEDIQIMYGVAGERDLLERELTHFEGYEGATPVRIGNGAVGQFQADVIGEVMVALDTARRSGVQEGQHAWPLQRALLTNVVRNYQRKDSGIWEMRGDPQFFTHSRVMTWAALDRAIRAVEDFDLDGPVERWTQLRAALRTEIEEKGWDAERNTYTQFYGSKGVDASLLQLPQVGFCEADDPRMLGTVAAIEEELLKDGLVNRYLTDDGADGLPPGENPFLACSFWMVEQYAHSGREDDARALMDRVVGLANDVGLLSEEYDLKAKRQAGNTPQALSHLALVRAADALSGRAGVR